jgi:uncharacterized cupredoxin-like copper-binding protein
VIEVFATDAFRFVPDLIEIQAGERIKFVVTNRGSLDHEFYVADEQAQEQHAREAAGGMSHDSSNGVFLEPGETKELEMRFDSPDALLAGCHVPGHYSAGMIATILVE